MGPLLMLWTLLHQHVSAMDVGAVKAPTIRRSQEVTTIGLDTARSVFQVHGIDAEGNAIIRRKLTLGTTCRVAQGRNRKMEYRD
jgi:hypothetical protein